MRKPPIANLKTVVRIETNIPKIQYGSGRIGAGYLDQYYPLKTVRGKFWAVSGTRVLTNGAVTYEQKHKLSVRFDVEISNAITKQMRFVVDNVIYTMESWKPIEEGRNTFIEFTLVRYSK